MSAAPVEELGYSACLSLLLGGVFGRVGLVTADGPAIHPVNYSILDQEIVVRTSPTSALAAAAEGGERLAFEVDHVLYAEHKGWSVLASGPGRLLDPDEIRRVERVWAPRPWAEGLRPVYVAITWDRLSGRRLGTGWTHSTELPVRRQV